MFLNNILLAMASNLLATASNLTYLLLLFIARNATIHIIMGTQPCGRIQACELGGDGTSAQCGDLAHKDVTGGVLLGAGLVAWVCLRSCSF